MKYIVAISFLFAFANTTLAQLKRIPLDGIAAQVGDNVILNSDIEAQVIQAKQAEIDADKNFRCTVLDGLMYQQLLLNQAILDSIVVTDPQVDAEMENRVRVIEEQIGGRDKMEKFYGKTILQIKAEFREIIRERMLAQEMERTITQNITVTPSEVKEFFYSLPADSIPYINAQMSFQQIVIFPEITKADKLAARTELEGILVQARSGRNFASLARKYSHDTGSARLGGEISAKRGMMVAPFEDAVFRLKEGDISEVFESEYGYHIVKLIERKGDTYKCAHILITPQHSTSALEKAALRMDSCYAKLKANEITWDDAVLKYSNDEATKLNRGIITNPYTGDQKWDAAHLNEIDQQIYNLTDRLNPGQITSPNLYIDMMTRLEGVRIVRLMNRTEPHKANLQQDYPLIQGAAEQDKRQRIISQWTKKKIKLAYIRVQEPYETCPFKHEWQIK